MTNAPQRVRLPLLFAAMATVALCAGPKDSPDPTISSIYPMAGQRGTNYEAVVRGTHLAGARALLLEGAGIDAAVLSVEPEEIAGTGDKTKNRPADLLKVQLKLRPDASTGPHEFRVVTRFGVSNKLTIHVTAEPVLSEQDPPAPLRQVPVVINGRIAHPGDANSYPVEVTAGETLTFEVASLTENFDPSLSLYEPTGSWFDPHRLNLVASNDEPLSFPGLSKDARMVRAFAHAGQYSLRVQGFEGQGGRDCVYQLRIVPGATPPPVLHPTVSSNWEERQFTRVISDRRLEELRQRGALEPASGAAETFRAVPEGTKDVPVMTVPGILEGRIDQPGQAHVIRLKIERPQAIAFEVQTPDATLPRFDPVFRLIAPDGHEIATDVYTKLNNNGLYMMKMIEAKTTVNLTASGDYTLQVRDITTNGAGRDFVYRVFVRPQIPHVGKIETAEDHVNLQAGSSHPMTVTIDREEGFRDYIGLDVEGLPAGVRILPAVEDHEEPPPLPNGGRLERYVAKQQRAVMMLAAADTAPLTEMPVRVRVVARLLRNGHPVDPIVAKEIWLMVTPAGKL